MLLSQIHYTISHSASTYPMMAILNSNLFSTILCFAAVFIISMLLLTQCCKGQKKKKRGPKKCQPSAALGPTKKGAGTKGKAGSAGGKKKQSPKLQRGDEPRFGPVKDADELLSYEDANKQLRRRKETPLPYAPPQSLTPGPKRPSSPAAPERGPPTPAAVTAAGPKIVEEKPADQGWANSPEYETLNFIKQQDVFGSGNKQQQEDDKPMPSKEPEENVNGDDSGNEAKAEEEGLLPGMAEQGGDYETLAEIQKGDIFAGN